MPARVVHFELPADDPDRAAKFYADAFGWKVEKWGGPTDYWLVTTGEAPEPGIDGGIGRRQDADDQITNTIDVPDLDAAVAAVEAAGGRITRAKGPVPGVGWLAYAVDTEGNPFGMMQADESAA
ncbi:MAG TPA: VOC family protein [Candidatus Limnocylindria bacterium]|nr:VOC family protein [Candidatus Limnocylindria bacterium]